MLRHAPQLIQKLQQLSSVPKTQTVCGLQLLGSIHTATFHCFLCLFLHRETQPAMPCSDVYCNPVNNWRPLTASGRKECCGQVGLPRGRRTHGQRLSWMRLFHVSRKLIPVSFVFLSLPGPCQTHEPSTGCPTSVGEAAFLGDIHSSSCVGSTGGIPCTDALQHIPGHLRRV